MKRDLFVFDLDGTLVDSFGHYFESLTTIFNELGTEKGVKFTDELRYPSLTEPLPKFLSDSLGENQGAAAMKLIRELSCEHSKHIRPFDGMMDVLDRLKTRGAKVAVWTNRDFPSASLILEHSGLKPMLDAFVSGSCVKDKKPHAEGMGKILNTMGLSNDGVVMIGDHEHDVWAAKSASVRAVRASWHTYWEIQACKEADHQFYKVKEFSDWTDLEP